MSTASDFLVTVVVNGRALGEFDTRSGGDTSVEIGVHRPGGGGQKSYGGRKQEHGDITVTRTYERERDMAELASWLRTQYGKPASVSEQPLDDDGNAWGKPTTSTGKFMSLDTGEYDSDSSDRRVMTLGFKIQQVS